MNLRRFTHLFYIFQFFFDFILIYAVDKLFFLSKGLDLYQIAILLAFWSGLTMLLEIPSGALADKWNKKNILIISGLFFSLCYFTWFFSATFWLFLLGFIFRTLGGTFTSGTLQAYIFDFLKTKKKEEEFEKIWGRGNAFRIIGIGIALSLGGILSVYSYKLVLIFSGLTPLIVSVIVFLMPQVKNIIPIKDKHYFSLLKGGLKQAFSRPGLIRVFLYSGIIMASLGVLGEYDQVLLFSWLSLPRSFIGIWLAICTGVGSVAAFYAHKVKHINWQVLNIIGMVIGIALISIAIFQSLFILGIILILTMLAVLADVLTQGIIQREINSYERATITSVNSFILEVGAICLGLIFGFIAREFGIQIGYGFFGAVILICLLGQYIFRKTYQVVHSSISGTSSSS